MTQLFVMFAVWDHQSRPVSGAGHWWALSAALVRAGLIVLGDWYAIAQRSLGLLLFQNPG